MWSLLVMLGAYLICCVISILIVKKRLFYTKRMIIGKETEENIEKLKALAEEIFNKHTLPLQGDYEIEIKGDKVKIGNEKVDVFYNGVEHIVINKAFTEIGAIFFYALHPFLYTLFLMLIGSIIFFYE